MSLGALFVPFQTPASITLTANPSSATNLTTYTFSSQALGDADPSRQILVGVFGSSNASYTISSVTVGGVSASSVIDSGFSGGNQGRVALWSAAVPTGTSGDIVVTWSNGMFTCGVAVYAMYDAATSATDTGSSTANPMTDTLSIPESGVAVGIAGSITAGSSYTWTNLTEDYDGASEGTETYTAASAAFETADAALALTVTPTGSPAQRGAVFASFAAA